MFFSGLFQRKSDAPVTTPAELADAIGLSYDTYTGKQISSQRAMRLTAVFSCVRVLAESVGMLPCNLYHLNGSLKQRATGERLHKLISTHPNAATAQTLMSSCSALDDCISDSFSGFSIDGVADFVQNDVVGNASTMLGYVSDAMKVVDSAVSDAARLLQGDISVLLPPPSSGKNFVEQVQKMWRTGKRLYGNASDLVTMIKTLSGVSLGSDLQPRGVWKTDSKTTATATQQRNVVASTLRTTAISEAAYAVTRLPAPTTSAVMQNATVGQSTTPAQSTGWPSVTHPALNNAPAVKNTVDLPTWEELTDIRDTLNTAIDKELSRTTSDALFLALRRVKADLNADINTRLEQSARIIQRTPDEVLPALVLAATWFDNAARDADIIRRNAITHPGFVPVIPLKVPVQ